MSKPAPPPASGAAGGPLALEVIRGREPGRRFVLASGRAILGTQAAGPGQTLIDLSAQQEPGSLRQVAPAHAELQLDARGIFLRDLGSPGGTFVNRSRLPKGERRLLAPGDTIQLGGIQLQVVVPPPASAPNRATTGSSTPSQVARSSPPTSPAVAARSRSAPVPAPTPAPAPTTAAATTSPSLGFPLPGGIVCRSWDDFLRISAQRWSELREELVSGRLAAHLHRAGFSSLAPDPHEAGSPDERLDAWLGRLPATIEARPELDVHPARLDVVLPAAGDVAARTRRILRIANTGYRLLRLEPRIDPSATGWIEVEGLPPGASLTVIDDVELTLAITRPPDSDANRALTSFVRLDSNGGTKTVEVALLAHAPRLATEIEPPLAGPVADSGGSILSDRLRTVSLSRRLLLGLAAGLAVGVVVVAGQEIGSRITSLDAGWLGPALLLAILGALGGVGLAPRGRVADLWAGGVAGGVCGLIVASVAIACGRVVASPILAGSVLGALAALVTIPLVPFEPRREGASL